MLFARPVIESQGYRASPRARATSFVLALVACALVFMVMVRMGAFTSFGEPGGGQLVAIDLSNSADKGKEKSKEPQKQQDQSKTAEAATTVRPVAPPKVPIPGKVAWPEGFIELSSKDYTATDVSKMKRSEGGGQAGAAGGGGGPAGAGEGPGGVRLYNAQWYRTPTDAEIGPYMPANRPPGAWAMIACRTIDKYHVEDCQEMGESPPGSGLARALRQASWQFLVRPPRENGKSLVGEWVKIRFDFTRDKRAVDEDAAG